ncbi:MAG: methyltransferase [Flavobacteriaceae bacterium]|nr:MAG: methyltransferase [Flavobacteriaceae bacterium]
MRNFLKKITHPLLKIAANIYFLKPRKYIYKEIHTLVHPEVFAPHFILSTKILLDFVATLNLNNKSFLELGCGSGIISLFAASKGAKVTASDINRKALEYLEISAGRNNLPLNIIYSDLFAELNSKYFDYIIINPPYYPKKPKNMKEKAWFCGEHFEYFQRLFTQLTKRKDVINTYLILSKDCNMVQIKKIAKANALRLKNVREVMKLKEKNFIFKLQNYSENLQ